MQKLIDTFTTMVKAMISGMPSGTAEPNPTQPVERREEVPQRSGMDHQPGEQVQPTLTVTEPRPRYGYPEGYRRQGEVRHGYTTFYRNGGNRRVSTYAEALGNPRRSHNYENQGISYEERVRNLSRPVPGGVVSSAHAHRGGEYRSRRLPWGRAESDRLRSRETENLPSEDKEVQALGKLLFQNCQLKQSKRNWTKLPRSISVRLDRVFEGIKPPQRSEKLTKDLEKINEECKNKLVDVILAHIEKHSQEINQKMSEHAEGIFDEAAGWARTRVLDHFHHRVNVREVNEWLAEDFNSITVKPTDLDELPVIPEDLTAAEDDDFITVHGTANKKRGRPDEHSPIEARNRFSPLIRLQTEEDEGTTYTFPPIPKTPKKPKLNNEIVNSQILEVEIIGTPAEDSGDVIIEELEAQQVEETITDDVSRSYDVIAESEGVIAVDGTEQQREELNEDPLVEADATEGPAASAQLGLSQPAKSSTSPSNPTTGRLCLSQPTRPSEGLVFRVPQEQNERVATTEGVDSAEKSGDNSEDIEVGKGATSTRSQSSVRTPPSPLKRLSLSQPDMATGGSVRIHHTTPKSHWRVVPGKMTKVLILADDIMDSSASHIPANWEVHILPKATLSDAVNVIDRLESTGGLRTVVTAIGWNNRNRAAEGIKKDVLAVGNAAKKKNLQLHFVGVSGPETVGQREVNMVARGKFLLGYVKPLSTIEVSDSRPGTEIQFKTSLNECVNVLTAHFLGLTKANPTRNF